MGHRAEARRRPVAPLAVQAELSEQEGCAKADEALVLRRAEDGELLERFIPGPKHIRDAVLFGDWRDRYLKLFNVGEVEARLRSTLLETVYCFLPDF